MSKNISQSTSFRNSFRTATKSLVFMDFPKNTLKMNKNLNEIWSQLALLGLLVLRAHICHAEYAWVYQIPGSQITISESVQKIDFLGPDV